MKRFLLTLFVLVAIGAPAQAQNPVSVTRWATFPVDTNSGTKSNGTLRVILATDQPDLSTTWKIDWTKIAGTTLDVNSGNKSNGTLRVVLATDQPALTNALKIDGSAVTQPVSGTFWQATQPVSGTFFQATQPVSGTVTANMGTVTADPFGANGDAASATGSISAKLRFIASTGIPITGTAAISAASLPLPALAASSTKQSDGTQKTQVVDGSGNVIASTSNALHVNCQSGCSGGTTDTDDGTVAGGQSTGIGISLAQVWDGSNWKRFTIGTAGTASAQVVTVQGIASGTNLNVTCANCSGTGVSVNEDVASANADPGTPAYTVRNDTVTGATTTDGDYQPMKSDSAGRVYVTGAGGTFPATQSGTWTVQPGNTANTTAWKVDGSAVTQPVSGTVTANMGTVTADPFGANADAASATGSISAKLRFIAATGIPITGTVTVGSHAVTNAGTFPIQDSQKVADDAAFTVGTTPVQPVGYLADQSSTDSVNEGDIGAARMTLDRVAYAGTAAVADIAQATATCYITSAASTNATNCKASPGNIYAIQLTNTTTTNYFLRLYNASGTPTCSSATGFVETLPALGATANGGINGRVVPPGEAFDTGIAFCLTGGGSSTDNTNAATGVYVTIKYK